MQNISLTSFLDISARFGTPKITKITQCKKQLEDGYDPRHDFWKGLRDSIISLHKEKRDKHSLERILDQLRDKKKITAYPKAIDGYFKFIGKKKISWFSPKRGKYTQGNITVLVNPELGLNIKNTPHLIKLYFKSDPISKRRVAVTCHMMDKSLRKHSPKGTIMCVLDVQRGKLHHASTPVSGLDIALKGELSYIEAVWDDIIIKP